MSKNFLSSSDKFRLYKWLEDNKKTFEENRLATHQIAEQARQVLKIETVTPCNITGGAKAVGMKLALGGNRVGKRAFTKSVAANDMAVVAGLVEDLCEALNFGISDEVQDRLNEIKARVNGTG